MLALLTPEEIEEQMRTFGFRPPGQLLSDSERAIAAKMK
jgi:hypothetical protein